MQHLYADVIRPLFFPEPGAFVQPLLDEFVASQDGLLGDSTLSTIPTRTRETGVDVDGAIRELRRRDAAQLGGQRGDSASLEEVRRLRLRSRMQYVLPPWRRRVCGGSCGRQQAGGGGNGKEAIVRRARERRDAFDREMKMQEEAALADFKEGIRKAVAM